MQQQIPNSVRQILQDLRAILPSAPKKYHYKAIFALCEIVENAVLYNTVKEVILLSSDEMRYATNAIHKLRAILLKNYFKKDSEIRIIQEDSRVERYARIELNKGEFSLEFRADLAQNATQYTDSSYFQIDDDGNDMFCGFPVCEIAKYPVRKCDLIKYLNLLDIQEIEKDGLFKPSENVSRNLAVYNFIVEQIKKI